MKTSTELQRNDGILCSRSMPASPKTGVEEAGTTDSSKIPPHAASSNITIISNVAAGGGHKTVLKNSQVKSIHNLSVSKQEKRSILVDTAISLRGTNKNDSKLVPVSASHLTQISYQSHPLSTCPSSQHVSVSPANTIAQLPKAAILMPSSGGQYTLLNAGPKSGTLLSPGGSQPLQVANMVVKTTLAGAVSAAHHQGPTNSPSQPTHVQYLVPSLTADGKIIIGPVSSSSTVRILPQAVVTTDPNIAAQSGGVIKPLAVTGLTKSGLTSQSPGVVLISGGRTGVTLTSTSVPSSANFQTQHQTTGKSTGNRNNFSLCAVDASSLSLFLSSTGGVCVSSSSAVCSSSSAISGDVAVTLPPPTPPPPTKVQLQSHINGSQKVKAQVANIPIAINIGSVSGVPAHSEEPLQQQQKPAASVNHMSTGAPLILQKQIVTTQHINNQPQKAVLMPKEEEREEREDKPKFILAPTPAQLGKAPRQKRLSSFGEKSCLCHTFCLLNIGGIITFPFQR